ncbi:MULTISPECIES: DUF4845 domain-containing protein [unclassified Luteimonas]|uniref:DUF4845 domain-containing protein n=1 Tax=unclassified Luteimonas TaxID=2629088 RepID=UPI001603CF16|nr:MULTISPECIES: DUF4845 domain-containing protein [unclassified Luteimonas]MBB1471529.1 DUF4845 domain-containing protein [Luteimonas sp. MC1782]MBB6599732.1 DUF4845 domain-containing protein [Luteimonas sp. MC1825]QOC87413.1 DUF4845 domain-containing protein [Luteimonas sp. MC1825]
MRNAQRGITLLGFVIVLAVVGLFAYVGMKLFPMYSEYYSVRSALKGLANEPGIANTDPRKIQDLFFRRLYISYAENVKAEHVKIKRVDNGWQMDVNYEVRKPVIANLDVVGRFDTTQMLTRSGDLN